MENRFLYHTARFIYSLILLIVVGCSPCLLIPGGDNMENPKQFVQDQYVHQIPFYVIKSSKTGDIDTCLYYNMLEYCLTVSVINKDNHAILESHSVYGIPKKLWCSLEYLFNSSVISSTYLAQDIKKKKNADYRVFNQFHLCAYADKRSRGKVGQLLKLTDKIIKSVFDEDDIQYDEIIDQATKLSSSFVHDYSALHDISDIESYLNR